MDMLGSAAAAATSLVHAGLGTSGLCTDLSGLEGLVNNTLGGAAAGSGIVDTHHHHPTVHNPYKDPFGGTHHGSVSGTTHHHHVPHHMPSIGGPPSHPHQARYVLINCYLISMINVVSLTIDTKMNIFYNNICLAIFTTIIIIIIHQQTSRFPLIDLLLRPVQVARLFQL